MHGLDMTLCFPQNVELKLFRPIYETERYQISLKTYNTNLLYYFNLKKCIETMIRIIWLRQPRVDSPLSVLLYSPENTDDQGAKLAVQLNIAKLNQAAQWPNGT